MTPAAQTGRDARPNPPGTVRLADYRPPDFRITHADLEVHLDFEHTRVITDYRVTRLNPAAETLRLDHEFITLESLHLDGGELDLEAINRDGGLHVPAPSDEFRLRIVNTLDPSANTALSGLYQSGDMLCTQCEAEGFRRIAPSQDRPDSLSVYSVKLVAEREKFPVLLCNGDMVDSGEVDAHRHFATWRDPFPKPTYLFAIVAGRLECLEDSFRTAGGKTVDLYFYTRPGDTKKCHHAMQSLKNAMRWDEDAYGREYDLGRFNVVAVEDFNMGAMENKSLNIFNTKYVLADPDMATDDDFVNVESVIGHEYFHNWSGNRVTCRDWFQLSLKEGFTVFREQQFSADRGSAGVKRINDVNLLRNLQFREDAGPMAHPVRPESYREINNFYTTTVYNKGAEVVRMLHTILGAEKFRAGADHYFATHDGEAVTTDDFTRAMESVSGLDLSRFGNWYSQAGTPRLVQENHYDEANRRFTVTFSQSCPATPGQPRKQPFVIPIRMALFDRAGERMDLGGGDREAVLLLDRERKSFEFDNVAREPVTSVLRGFSAPVHIDSPASRDELEFLLAHDDDPFNRWEAGQKLFLGHILRSVDCLREGLDLPDPSPLVNAVNGLLTNGPGDGAFLSRLISLPGVDYIFEHVTPTDPAMVRTARHALKSAIAARARSALMDRYRQCRSMNTGGVEHEQMAARRLANACLDYLCTLDDEDARRMAVEQLRDAACMTDAAAALARIADSDDPRRGALLDEFYTRWKHEPLVVDRWLRAQAMRDREDTLETVTSLTAHEAFDHKNPNKVYALILGFTHGNPFRFHAGDGSGYEFLRQWVAKLDPVNPQVAARLVSALNDWKKYTPELSARMRDTLAAIRGLPELSPDVSEIVEKNLA